MIILSINKLILFQQIKKNLIRLFKLIKRIELNHLN